MFHASKTITKPSTILIVVAPDNRLDARIVEEVTEGLKKEQCSCGNFSWLNPSVACRWTLFHKKEDACVKIHQSMKALSKKRKVDWGLISSQQSYPKVLISDMESTIIQEECLDEIAHRMNVHEAVSTITKLAMEGSRNFAWSLRKRLDILKGASRAILESVSLTPTPGALAMLSCFKKKGVKVVLVSGGLDYFARKVAQKMNFDAFESNHAVLDEAGFVDLKEGMPILDAQAKGQFLKDYAKKYACHPDDIVAIGDGANDQILLKKAGISVAYRPHVSLEPYADIVIKHTDLHSVDKYFLSQTRED